MISAVDDSTCTASRSTLQPCLLYKIHQGGHSMVMGHRDVGSELAQFPPPKHAESMDEELEATLAEMKD